jgi:outer membrane lipoprotein-sorting protein
MNTSFRRRFFCLLLCLSVAAGMLAAQTITTADAFFSAVSDNYAKINDYSATIVITAFTGTKNETMSGRALFKKPNLLRIDFSNPDRQTIVFNGEVLTIYLPSYNVVLNQSVDKGSGASGASLATPQGLSLMKRYYSIAYESGPDPVALDEKSKEQVVVLTLTRRSTTEMFRAIRLMISPDTKLIRRIDAKTISGDQILFDFTAYSLDQGILDNRFVYDSPASANMFNDFLFSD